MQAEIDDLNEKRKQTVQVGSKSGQIVNQARSEKLAEIFEKLDNDNDGEISAGRFHRQSLNTKLQHAFKPLFQELIQLQQPLDKEEFIDASLRLYDVSKSNIFILTNFKSNIDIIPKRKANISQI